MFVWYKLMENINSLKILYTSENMFSLFKNSYFAAEIYMYTFLNKNIQIIIQGAVFL